MTPQEIFLWRRISCKQIEGVQFYRQKPIGPYIVDFYAKRPKLIIELDGGQHFEDVHIQKDQDRDSYLSELGFVVLRFDNHSVVKNWNGVGKVIVDTILRKKMPILR